jgi:hypothetical protein
MEPELGVSRRPRLVGGGRAVEEMVEMAAVPLKSGRWRSLIWTPKISREALCLLMLLLLLLCWRRQWEELVLLILGRGRHSEMALVEERGPLASETGRWNRFRQVQDSRLWTCLPCWPHCDRTNWRVRIAFRVSSRPAAPVCRQPSMRKLTARRSASMVSPMVRIVWEQAGADAKGD